MIEKAEGWLVIRLLINQSQRRDTFFTSLQFSGNSRTWKLKTAPVGYTWNEATSTTLIRNRLHMIRRWWRAPHQDRQESTLSDRRPSKSETTTNLGTDESAVGLDSAFSGIRSRGGVKVLRFPRILWFNISSYCWIQGSNTEFRIATVEVVGGKAGKIRR